MTIIQLRLAASLLFAAVALLPGMASAGGNHGHHDDHEEEAEPKGPNGGTWLQQGEVAVEITLYEHGIEPEMRAYLYRSGTLVSPDQVDLTIELARLGGVVEPMQFYPERDYLVSPQPVREPHSFDVSVRASIAGESYHWEYESHEGRTEIQERMLTLAGVETEMASSQVLTVTETVFGVVQPVQQQVYSVSAPYEGIVESLLVHVGDKVNKGQTIAIVSNSKTLQRYKVTSPASGEVTQQWLHLGDHTGGRALMQVADFSQVWIDLSVFPNALDKVSTGMPLTLFSMHAAESGEAGVASTISYIAPIMTGGHIARARAVVDNADGHWRPGMHVQAKILTSRREVPLAVSVDALQRFRDRDVVFARYGDTFEVRMVELGAQDGEYVEVLSGLEPGTEYVTANSYLLLADVMKDGASHSH
ncbi:efflux RND transporter periplasmic adaptor subunit [Ferrimonas balearica]|uniref:efflux RND transporter periplasmic adaptor subunit n=1 Tax=Ferrimonas balearica TaxID=44012 RepID=UPI001C991E28|nr:efflux RND transporter periplasmic adaptor subunit [Ferrimonas balearica]MBY5920664.1 efflux RND transporter periplasmic adaptor subunit [Ferrimonas balearica]MBY5996651.1 efflux RND transporter periplasmic adaptor subunit [Ferrimonas balearica]